jgi:hypothetical protein
LVLVDKEEEEGGLGKGKTIKWVGLKVHEL